MSYLNELKKWISSYEKINKSEPSVSEIKSKIKDLLQVEKSKSDKTSKKIFFRDSVYSNYEFLRDELLKDYKFVIEYKGVDLHAYIDDALSWSEKGNTTTEVGWLLTLRNWMRNAKRDGKLIMKKVVVKKQETGHTNF